MRCMVLCRVYAQIHPPESPFTALLAPTNLGRQTYFGHGLGLG